MLGQGGWNLPEGHGEGRWCAENIALKLIIFREAVCRNAVGVEEWWSQEVALAVPWDIHPFVGGVFSQCCRQNCTSLSGLTELRKSLPSIKKLELGIRVQESLLLSSLVDRVDTCCLRHTGGKGLEEKSKVTIWKSSIFAQDIWSKSARNLLWEKECAVKIVIFLFRQVLLEEGGWLNLQVLMVRVAVVTFLVLSLSWFDQFFLLCQSFQAGKSRGGFYNGTMPCSQFQSKWK